MGSLDSEEIMAHITIFQLLKLLVKFSANLKGLDRLQILYGVWVIIFRKSATVSENLAQDPNVPFYLRSQAVGLS